MQGGMVVPLATVYTDPTNVLFFSVDPVAIVHSHLVPLTTVHSTSVPIL